MAVKQQREPRRQRAERERCVVTHQVYGEAQAPQVSSAAEELRPQFGGRAAPLVEARVLRDQVPHAVVPPAVARMGLLNVDGDKVGTLGEPRAERDQ